MSTFVRGHAASFSPVWTAAAKQAPSAIPEDALPATVCLARPLAGERAKVLLTVPAVTTYTAAVTSAEASPGAGRTNGGERQDDALAKRDADMAASWRCFKHMCLKKQRKHRRIMAVLQTHVFAKQRRQESQERLPSALWAVRCNGQQ